MKVFAYLFSIVTYSLTSHFYDPFQMIIHEYVINETMVSNL